MKNLRLRKGSYQFSININKIKFFVGKNTLEKIKIFRLFEGYKNITESEYSKYHNTSLEIYLDDYLLKPKKLNVFKIDSSFSLQQNLKLQATSILQKSLLNILSSPEYIDTYETIQTLLDSICITFNENNIIQIKTGDFTHVNFIKLLEPFLLIDELESNELDLSIEESLILQIDIIKPILNNLKDEYNILLFDYPIINKTLYKNLCDINNCLILVKCEEVNIYDSIEDFILLNDTILDLSDEEELYSKVCCSILNNSNLLEGKNYMEKQILNKSYILNFKDYK